MEQHGFPEEGIEVTIGEKKLGIIATALGLPVMLGALLLYPLVRGGKQGSFVFDGGSLLGLLAFLAVYAALVAIHELLHALGYHLFGHSKTKIGFDWKHMMALAAAQSPMPITAYRWSVVLPTLVLVPPLVFAGLDMGSFPAYAMGVFLFVSGFGDGWILWALRRYRSGMTVMDHPTKPGCVLYQTEK